MPVLVIQNFDDTGLGQIGTALALAGIEVELCRAHHGDALPSREAGYQGLIVLGGGQDALDDAQSPYFPELLALIRRFAEAERSVLGVCLGSQLIARAFGGDNQLGVAQEFGWCEVSLTEAAAADPVFAGLPQCFQIFQWHDDTFSLPGGAVRLAASRQAENQAFRLGRAVYGIQFHFEADRPLIEAWSRTFAATIAGRHPDWPERLPQEAKRHGPQADAAGRRIAEAWIATLAQTGRPAAATAQPRAVA